MYKRQGQYGITSNVFLPIITTETFRTTQPEALKALETKSPLKRIGTTEDDCGPVIAFLASDDAGYLNGQSFMLDGGIHMPVSYTHLKKPEKPTMKC